MKRTFFLFLATFFSLSVLTAPHQAHAEITASYNGCFERSSTDSLTTVWLQSPICSITITNYGSKARAYNFSIVNLDPAMYLVEDSTGEDITATRTDVALQFTAVVSGAGASKTVTISPWDYNEDTSDFWFAGIADTQTNPDSDTPNEVAVTIMNQLDALRPKLTTLAGDVIGGDSSDVEEHEAEYEAYDEIFQEYDGSTFMVPGNHDAYQDLDTYYSAYYGDQNYTFVYGNTRFIGINSNDDVDEQGRLVDEVYSWLEDTLESATEENIIVFWHHPLVVPTYSGANGVPEDQQLEVAQLLIDHDVDLLLVGHVHGYDDKIITGDDIEGLNGSLHQIVLGGAGGKRKTYSGDHFFMLFHIEGDTVTPIKYDYSDFDLSVDYESDNDGSAESMHLSIFNNSEYEIPYMQVPAHTNTTGKVYASSSEGEFLPFLSQVVDGVNRGYMELSLEPHEILEIEVKEHTQAYSGVTNQYSADGVITFSRVPTASDTETGLEVLPSGSRTSRITIRGWNANTDERKWTERTTAKNTTTYTVTDAWANRYYNVYMNGKFVTRAQANDDGVLTFESAGPKKRKFRLSADNTALPQFISALPASRGGGNLLTFTDGGTKLNSFFTYDKSLSHGYESIYADVDGDNELEIVTVPKAGVAGHVRVVEQDGTVLANKYPFGKSFTGGVNMVAADVTNNGKDEVVITAEGSRKPYVHIFSYRAKKGKLKRIKKFRPFSENYTSGVEIATGNIDGKAGDEIVTSARWQNTQVSVYKWLPNKRKVKRLTRQRPFPEQDNPTDGISPAKKKQRKQNADVFVNSGVTIATGDVNYDGKDEVIAALATEGSDIQILNYRKGKKKLKLLEQKRVYSTEYNEGVQLFAGNIDKNNRDEIVVVPRSNTESFGTIRAYRLKKNMRMQRVASTRPYGTDGSSMNVALVDITGNGMLDIVAAPNSGSSTLKVYKKKKRSFLLLDSYSVYESAFTGGVQLTQ